MNPKRVQKQLNLAAKPNAELLALLEGIEDRPARLHPDSAALLEPVRPLEVRLKVGEAVAMHSVAELLSSARKDNSLTLEQLGQALGVSKGRVSQLERRGANLESATLARVAEMLGYDASIVFRPRDTKRRTLEALLIQSE
jgi:DNA-binding XRE family transcriptional regulator